MDPVKPASPDSPEPLPGAPAAVPPANGASAEVPGRGANGRFRKGESGNKRGRPPGIPNLNDALVKAVKQWRLGDRTWLNAILTKALTDPDLARVVLDKILVNATPAGPAISIKNSHHSQETHVRIGEHLGDPAVRDAVADLTQRLAARGAWAGTNGHVRE